MLLLRFIWLQDVTIIARLNFSPRHNEQFGSFCFIFRLPGGAFALKIVQVKVPLAALLGHSVQLECIFSLDGDSLYAVKWYRGVDEFYRYVPAEEPRATVFGLNGIEVDVSNFYHKKRAV